MNNVVFDVLTRLITTNVFGPTVSAFCYGIRKNEQSFYHQTKQKKGYEAAEDELERFVTARHLREFSGSLLPIAMGIRDMARGDAPDMLIVEHNDLNYTKPYGFGKNTILVVAPNPVQPGCGCAAVEGSSAWGPYGSLGLKYVIICVDEIKQIVQIDLILPLREMPPYKDGFTVFSIQSDGYVYGQNREIYVLKNACFHDALGLSGEPIVSRMMTAGGDTDSRVGFPGAQEYIAEHIGALGPYFSAVAAKTIEHAH